MKKLKYILQIFIVVLSLQTLQSCREDALEIAELDRTDVASYSDLFNAFWDTMNNDYNYFNEQEESWDNVYKKYSPKFKKLTTFNKADVSPIEAEKEAKALEDDIKNGLAFRYEGDILRATKIQPNTYMKCISTTTDKGVSYDNSWGRKNQGGKTQVQFQRDERISQLMGTAHIPKDMQGATFSEELGNYSWYIEGGEKMWVTYYRGEKYHQVAKRTSSSSTVSL